MTTLQVSSIFAEKTETGITWSVVQVSAPPDPIGLSFLEKLLTSNFSVNSKQVYSIFTQLSQSQLEKLELVHHLKCKKGCRKSAIALLDLYLRHNPEYEDIYPVGNDSLKRKVNFWRRKNKFNSLTVERYSPQNEQEWTSKSESPGMLLKGVLSSRDIRIGGSLL